MTTLNTIIEEENTPDTEMVKEWYASLPERPRSHTPMSVSAEEVAGLLTSRDTYWKERVRSVVEGMKVPYNSMSDWAGEIDARNKVCDDILQALDNLK